MILAVASGKGGTGKTLVATNMASVAGEVQLVDCDAEEPNVHLFIKPIETEGVIPVTLSLPQIDEEKCTHCGRCAEACEYHALMVLGQQVLLFEELCHGCGACSFVCPEGAISERPREIGRVEVGKRGSLRLIQGVLHVGEPMPSPVIRKAKALIDPSVMAILDAPPGTSCPVVETVKGADFCCLVTEPTPFGLYDLTLAVGMVKKLGVKMGVVLNRADVGDQGVREYLQGEEIPLLAEIPFDPRISEVCSRGGLVVEELPHYRGLFSSILLKVKELSSGG